MKEPNPFFTQLANIGIDSSTPIELIRKIQLTNLFSFFLSVVVAVAAILTLPISQDSLQLNLVRIGMAILYSLPMLFNLNHWYYLSRYYLILLPLFMMILLSSMYGAYPATSLQIGMLPVVILPVILFGMEEFKRLFITMVAVFATPQLVDMAARMTSMQEGDISGVFSNEREVFVTIFVTLILFFLEFLLYQGLLSRAERSLEQQREHAENLLKNILPEEIIPILKKNPEVIAEHFDSASILFADIANFTPLAARKSAREIVTILNEVFSHFDDLVEQYGLEKIKTIGDCYMVAAGVPQPKNEHARVLINLAMDFKVYIENNTFEGEKLNIRMGISSGPVIAGVIGRKKFIYDLWGDTVNTASRMESQGKIGEIQITEHTQRLIQDEFYCEQLDNIHVKGKGDMAIFLVKGKKRA